MMSIGEGVFDTNRHKTGGVRVYLSPRELQHLHNVGKVLHLFFIESVSLFFRFFRTQLVSRPTKERCRGPHLLLFLCWSSLAELEPKVKVSDRCEDRSSGVPKATVPSLCILFLSFSCLSHETELEPKVFGQIADVADRSSGHFRTSGSPKSRSPEEIRAEKASKRCFSDHSDWSSWPS